MPDRPDISDILEHRFGAPIAATDFSLAHDIRALHPNSTHLVFVVNSETEFPIAAYLKTQNVKSDPATLTPLGANRMFNHITTEYEKGKGGADGVLFDTMRTGAFSFSWKNVTFTVYKAVWEHGWCVSYFYNLVFDAPDGTDAVGRELAEVVYRYSYALKKEMWVFEDASWAKSTQLWHSIQAASWDEVVLEDAFTADLRRDTETFFASREIYASLGIAWKRGILFLGPPGNGKTQVISALLKDLPYQALYVKSFTTKKGPESGIRRIFSHARNCAPCILVLEDLDAMIKPQSRSFFLNEMDGLAENSGVLTIATTNHPERIDDAILNRPSRFDVKYTFALPTPALRARYTGKWLGKVRALIQASDMWRGESLAFGDEEKLLAAVVDKTEGWSFAFLKELFVSFLLRLAHDRAKGTTSADGNKVLLEQVHILAAQIMKTKKKSIKKDKKKRKGKGDKEDEQDEEDSSEDSDSGSDACDDCDTPDPNQ